MSDETGPAFGGARDDWQRLADRLVLDTAPFASPSGALVRLPGPASASGPWSDGMEGFARTFLLAALRVSGARGEDPHDLLGRFRRGLLAGVEPGGPERWPTIGERRQAVVEAASVSIALSETRTWLWDRLDDAERVRIIDWLAGVVGTAGYSNNWIWFQNVIEAFLASVGGPWRQDDLDRNAEIGESLYVGDGWYSDGASPDGTRQSFDYYAGWAWHVYPLLESRIRQEPLAPVHRDRLAEFTAQARELVGAQGAPLFQGRSLTYRFGMLAPFWTAAIAGVSPLEPGETRTLAGRVMSHFLDAGAIDERGLLPIGWHRRFLSLRQVYTSGSSPYWAAKGFLALLLPEDHPEWSASPADHESRTPSVRALAAPGWLVARTPEDGVVRVVNHGSDGFRGPAGAARTDNPFYQRLAYSNVTSPDLSPDAIAQPLDSHVALLDAAGRPSHRDAIERVHLTETVAVSRSRVHWLDTESADVASWAGLRRGPMVTVASVVNGPHELRVAWWTAPTAPARPSAAHAADDVWPVDAGPWRFRIGGWTIAAPESDVQVDGASAARSDGLTTTIAPVRGLDRVAITTRSGANPFGENSFTPSVAADSPSEAGALVAAVVTLSAGSDVERDPVRGLNVDADRIVVRWHDGRLDVVPTQGEVSA